MSDMGETEKESGVNICGGGGGHNPPKEKESGVSDIERKKPRIIEFGPCHDEVQEIESLRQLAKELEELCIYQAKCNLELRDELAALKAGQGEPVLWMHDTWDTIRHEEWLNGDSYKQEWYDKPLYTTPTIPEGWVMMPKKVSMEMTIAASRKLGECDSGFWTRGGMLESVLIDKMYDELIAAAPKLVPTIPEE